LSTERSIAALQRRAIGELPQSALGELRIGLRGFLGDEHQFELCPVRIDVCLLERVQLLCCLGSVALE
jgi:hypothetical protein